MHKKSTYRQISKEIARSTVVKKHFNCHYIIILARQKRFSYPHFGGSFMTGRGFVVVTAEKRNSYTFVQ